jgi:5-methylcytosine-specific restriction endonuclease McrA
MSQIPESVRQFVYERDNRRCRWCGRSNLALHIHHVTYRSQGGQHDPDNLILLCYLDHQLVHSDKGYYAPLLAQLMDLPGVTGFALVRRVTRR